MRVDDYTQVPFLSSLFPSVCRRFAGSEWRRRGAWP
jgi:hypothetical protein